MMLSGFFYDNFRNKTVRMTFSAAAFSIAMVVMGSGLSWKYQCEWLVIASTSTCINKQNKK